MLSLANDLIAFSQLKNGKFRKILEWINIKSCIQEVVSIQKYKAQLKHISIEIIVEGIEENQLVFTDSYRVQQVVLNLLSNALKFTDENGCIIIKC